MAQFVTPSLMQLYDASGSPYAGGKLYIYSPGTTTLLSIYTDEDMLTPAANPIVADSAGIFSPVFMAELSFKAVFQDSDGNVIKTVDPAYSIGLTSNITAAEISFDGSVIGFAAENVQDAIEEVDATYAPLSGAAFTGSLSITKSVSGTFLTLESTDAGAGVGPVIELYRNSASPAASDLIGGIDFYGEDSAGNKEQYGSLQYTILDPTSASEDGYFVWSTKIAGTLAARLRLGHGLYTPGVTGGDQGANTINAGAVYDDGNLLLSAVGIAALSAGAVGTYAMLLRTPNAAAVPGDTVAASDLKYSNVGALSSGSSPNGTWRLMGQIGSTSDENATSLWLRIS